MFFNIVYWHLNDPGYAGMGSYLLFSLVKVDLEVV